MTWIDVWIRARVARIHRTPDCGAWLEAQANEALAVSGVTGPRVITRQRWRVSTQIRGLARVFAIAFAR